MLRVLPVSFYRRSATEVAHDLIGKILIRKWHGVDLSARIVETEAYLGTEDPASHAYRGPTPRNRPMFDKGGIWYVYRSYGVHHCLNVVTGAPRKGEAVLLRAGEPLLGQDRMLKNRGLPRTAPVRAVLSGPGKLCQALRIGLDFNFHSVAEVPLQIAEDDAPPPAVITTPRIGISKARELYFRYCAAHSSCLSRRLAPLSR